MIDVVTRKSISCNLGNQENALDRQIIIVINYFLYGNDCQKAHNKFQIATQDF
jgi:hypothetical protein